MRSITRLLVVIVAIAALAFLVAPASGSSPIGAVHLTKICPTWETTQTCTVQRVTAGPIPVGTVVAYSGLFSPTLSAMVTLTTPDSSTATGHCTLFWRMELFGNDGFGTCTFTTGTGSLSGLHASLKIADHPDTLITDWDGIYFFAAD
jgi:hypothetical protein